MSFLVNKKALITIGVGIVSVVGLAALGIKSVSDQIENAFNFLDDDFVDFDEDDLEDDSAEFEEDSEDDSSTSPLSFFKR